MKKKARFKINWSGDGKSFYLIAQNFEAKKLLGDVTMKNFPI